MSDEVRDVEMSRCQMRYEMFNEVREVLNKVINVRLGIVDA